MSASYWWRSSRETMDQVADVHGSGTGSGGYSLGTGPSDIISAMADGFGVDVLLGFEDA